MAKLKWKGGAMLSPLPPCLVTVRAEGKDNVFTVAWTGITNTIPPKTYISVRPSRYSYELIQKSGIFVINLTSEDLAKSADTCGVFTGRKVNKFEKCHLNTEEVPDFDCLMLSDSPVSLACRVTDTIPLGSHTMFLADIESVYVRDDLMKEDKLCLDKAKLVAYAHGDYYTLGRKIGSFGWSVAKKKKQKR